jgi:UDP-N-acetylglucosamine 1-carboxyvinyltransferase
LPGGCAIGARPVDLHLKAFEAMGVDIHIEQGYVKAAALRGLKGADISFPMVSVGATEHAMLAAVLADGDTVLRNVAREPEIVDLAECLNAMGARIEGAGTEEIQIKGVTSLKAARHSVVPDRIEAGTFAIAAAAATGDVLLGGARAEHIGALIDVLRQAGVTVESVPEGVRVARANGRLVHHERTAVGNRDAAPDSGRTEVLPPLQHLEQDTLALVVELQERDQLLEDVVLRIGFDIEGDCISIEKFTQFHVCLQVPEHAFCGSGGAKHKGGTQRCQSH